MPSKVLRNIYIKICNKGFKQRGNKLDRRASFFLSILLTVLIFIVIFSTIDLGVFLQNIKEINIWFFFLSVALLIPPYLLIAYRWKVMISDFRVLSFAESLKLNIVGQSINVVTPAKLGDFTKAYFIRNEKLNGKVALGACFFEKILDFFMLSIFALFGITSIYTGSKELLMVVALFVLIFFPVIVLMLDFREGSKVMKLVRFFIPIRKINLVVGEILSYFQVIRKNKRKVLGVFLINFLLWLVFVFQGYILFLALGIEISILAVYGLLPLGIFVGLIPVTLSGMGTRDAAFIILFSAFASSAEMALYGILFSLRYFLPAILGLFWVKEVAEKK